MGDSTLREAVTVSSPSLSRMLDKVDLGAEISDKDLHRAAQSLTRYAQRITGRATPFGLYAGVGQVELADAAEFTVCEGPIKHVTPSLQWTEDLVRRNNESRQERHAIKVVANNLLTTRGNKVVLDYNRVDVASGKDSLLQATKVKLSPLLATTLAMASVPISYSTLEENLLRRIPGAKAQEVDHFLHKLLKCEILLPSTLSLVQSRESLTPLSSLQGRSTAGLAEVERLIDGYESAPTDDARRAWHELHREVESISKYKATPQLDTLADCRIQLPQIVATEIEKFATTLWQVAPGGGFAHIRAYRQAFAEKYGISVGVKLHELVDPVRGLGFPESYRNPASHAQHRRTFGLEGERRKLARSQILGGLLIRGMESPQREVELTAADIESLASEKTRRPEASIEACVQLLARDAESLNSGQFLVAPTPVAGTHTVGAMTGRFTKLLGIQEEVRRELRSAYTDGILAQVSFLPARREVLNLMNVPEVTDHEIPIGTFTDSDRDHVLDWRELIVADDGERLRLYTEKGTQEVIPVIPHCVNLSEHAPNIVRFLDELKYSGDEKKWGSWDWSEYSSLPVLPRVKHGRQILSLLTWKITPELTKAAKEPDTWDVALKEWRKSYSVDQCVLVRSSDLAYEVDLDHAFHRELLRSTVIRTGASSITELPQSIAGGSGYGWSRNRATELVVPLHPKLEQAAQVHPPGRRVPKPLVRERHYPGGDWSYVQLVTPPEVQDELLSLHIPDAMSELENFITSWFFIRYGYPDHHIRLRMNGPEAKLKQLGFPLLINKMRDWQDLGLLSDFRILSYEPEITRYGGSKTVMSLAEHLFALDSRMAVRQIPLIDKSPGGRLSPLVTCAINYATLLNAMGDWNWLDWFRRNVMLRNDGGLKRDEIATVRRFCEDLLGGEISDRSDAFGNLNDFSASPLVGQLGVAMRATGDGPPRGSWRSYSILSFLHMHHNRLIGINRTSEIKSLRLLSHVANSLSSRPQFP
ncbi:lantibiotic dehydratase [Streptomyces sp. NPDC006355]|uniref:lantibiotic dehydratase n=1 Tax=Streptomyces sp. NPDC006355 TaxID=3156758 RepID=UPI0033ACA2E9